MSTILASDRSHLIEGNAASPDPGGRFRAFIHPCNEGGNSFEKSNEEGSSKGKRKDEEEPQDKLQIDIAPNPTSGKVHIRVQGRSPEGSAPEKNGKRPGRVRVWDQMGRQVLEEAFSSGRNTIDLSGHPQGIYLVRVRKGDAVRTAKVVKE